MLVRPASGLPMDSKVLRPINTGLPMVRARKCFISAGKRHGRRFWIPMTRPFPMAAMSEMIITSHGHRRLDGGVALVTFQPEVGEAEVKDGRHRGIERHARQGEGRTLKL